MLRKILPAALFLALPGLAQAAPPDYTDYQSLLNRYLVRLQPESKTADTQFDYERLYLDEGIWRIRRSPTLEKIRGQLLSVNPSQLPAVDRTAWAINTYNFLVIDRATMNLLVPRKRFVRYRSVEDIRTPEGKFFSARVVSIEGLSLSLAEFERRYVYGDTTPILRPRSRAVDPRLTLALASGHMGDPPLAPRAYRGDSLDKQLDAAAAAALAQPRFVVAHDGTGRLDVSNYMVSRAPDYGGNEGLLPFIERHAPANVGKSIRKHRISAVTVVLPEDRALNQWPHPKKDAASKPMSTGS